MITLQPNKPSSYKICIVGCLHGNENFGEKVFEYIKHNQSDFPGVTAVLANEPAMKANKRFIDEDLNRSFPGDSSGNTESRIAFELEKKIGDFDYVLDLHTTSSPLERTTAIVPNLSEATKRILAASPYKEIIRMEEALVASSLIGNVPNAISLELNEEYALTPAAIQEITGIITNLINQNKHSSQLRSIYKVKGTIPLDIKLPPNAKNFELIPSLGITPFLIHEREYTTHQGFNVELIDTVTEL